MKRKLSLLLALVMILSLVPMTAFAATTNSVDKVPKVSKDTELTGSLTPTLRIEEKNAGEFGSNGQTFRMNLEKAEWLSLSTLQTAMPNFYIRRLSDTTVEATVYSSAADGINSGKAYFNLPMLVKVKEEGETKVTVDARDSAVSGGTYVIAVVSEGATVVSVDKSKTVKRGDNEIGASFTIDETSVGSLTAGTTQRFTVKLPSEFAWAPSGTPVTTVTATGGLTATATIDSGNDRVLIVDVVVPTGTPSVRRSITVNPVIKIKKDAKLGDVKVDIDGKDKITDEFGVKIAEYKDYGVTIEVKEVKEFFAGRFDSSYVTAKVKIEEDIENSLFDGRVIDFELPAWVKVQHNAPIKVTSKNSPAPTITVDKYGSKFELTVPSRATKEKFELEIPLTIQANKAGDIALTIKGAGVDKTELVIAKAIAPLTAEIKVQDVRIGVQKQDAPEIIIKETKAGALLEKKDLLVQFRDKDYGFRFDDAKVEVIDGNLEIDEDNSGKDDANTIKIAIKNESSKPSTIKISGIKLTLDRTVAEGPFQVDVKGNAVVENTFDISGSDQTTYNVPIDYYNKDFVGRVARTDFINVVTKAPGELAAVSKFVIDSKTYKVIQNKVEIEKVMDVAPFIADGRTFLPIRFVAEALGVSEDNIIWNAATKTVTIMKGNRIAAMTIGSNVITVNGTPVQMDTKAMVKDGRTVLPVRFVAQALGAQIDWNAETRTVTVTQ